MTRNRIKIRTIVRTLKEVIMTLFQIVTIENPIKLTPQAKGQLEILSEKLNPSMLANFAKESWEGLLIGLSLGKEGDDPYFIDFCERDLER